VWAAGEKLSVTEAVAREQGTRVGDRWEEVEGVEQLPGGRPFIRFTSRTVRASGRVVIT
jgi:hypothetical protein